MVLPSEPTASLPAQPAVVERFRAANDGHLSMAEIVEMLQRQIAALLIVDDDGTDVFR